MGFLTDFLKEIPLTAVLREKMTILEADYEKLKAERDDLKAECQNLRNQVQQLKDQNESLNKQLNPAQPEDPSDIEVKILIYLGQSSESLGEKLVAGSQHLNAQTARFHLEELKARGLAESFFIRKDTQWHLTQEGRRFLVKKGLLR